MKTIFETYFELTTDSTYSKVKIRVKKPKSVNLKTQEDYEKHFGEIGKLIYKVRKESWGYTNALNFLLKNKIKEEDEEQIKASLVLYNEKLKTSVKGKTWSNPDYIAKVSESRKKAWSDPALKIRRRENWLNNYWNTDRSKAHREKLSSGPNRFNLVEWQKEHSVKNTKELFLLKGKKVNDLEFTFAGILTLLNIEFEIDKVVETNGKTYFIDFYLPKFNLAIELFGDYWHCNPKFFKSEDDRRGIKAKEIWEVDSLRNKQITEQGMKYIVYWESYVRLNTHNIIKFLTNLKEK
jgi:very-short-patch-repair endonuclease